MGINWLCTGKSEHAYKYATEDGVETGYVLAIDFKAEPDVNEDINELWETKPVLTQVGIEAFVGLIPYAQGFTVLADSRLTDNEASDVIAIEYGETVDLYSTVDLIECSVGGYLSGGSGGDVEFLVV